MKHIFIGSLGGSPAVFTETLWALMHPDKLDDPAHREREPVVPDVVHLVTTTFFNPRAYSSTIERDEDIKTKISTLYQQYEHQPPEIIITVAKDPEKEGGEAYLQDIRSLRDNTVFANCLTEIVYNYSQKADCVIHMSLAGGRKTMSSYAHSAMMFFGRLQDELTHVLLMPEIYERTPGFWWPEQLQKVYVGKDKVEFPTSLDDVQVDLVTVPFVHLNVRLPGDMPPEAFDANLIVEFIEFETKREPVIVDGKNRTITAGSSSVKLPPQEFAYFALYAIARKQGWPGAGSKEEGVGGNAAGFIKLDNLRYGLEHDGTTERNTREFNLFRELMYRLNPEYQHLDNDPEEQNKSIVAKIGIRIIGAAYDDRGLTKFGRGRLNRVLKKEMKNPYLLEYLLPVRYRSDTDEILGVNIPADRIELRGFSELELSFGP